MDAKTFMTIGGIDYKWDLEKGQLQFDGGEAVLFWVSAMKTFFETIEEVAGSDAAKIVLETTGFRQGLMVGNEFKKKKDISLSDLGKFLEGIYPPAGWGKVTVEKIDDLNGDITLLIQDDWEYKLNQLDGKKCNGSFVPAHFAGVLTGLYNDNFWFKTAECQSGGNSRSRIEYFRSVITVQNNMKELSRRQEAAHIQQLEILVEEKTAALQELIRELSSPVIPVFDGIVVVPMIGSYDEERFEELVVSTLEKLPGHEAQFLLLDLTGLNQKASQDTARFVGKLGAAAKLLGIETILVGISAELAEGMAGSMVGLNKFISLQTLQHGIFYALGKSGLRIV
ncbi:STAS domain-containing protein [Peribacillus sp. SCS-37]|uniref:STAS domain-containing protein n=1 Tax=Paraperibacillus esterisolvens TaxID=3115296 RepID=UPI0039058722